MTIGTAFNFLNDDNSLLLYLRISAKSDAGLLAGSVLDISSVKIVYKKAF
ncbi:MAG TPA: hypothetical protein VE818_11635 [Nitrososphaeraceae archaeon]|nr:hypothetical protein [Nitrososphaeraceae archaeon]